MQHWELGEEQGSASLLEQEKPLTLRERNIVCRAFQYQLSSKRAELELNLAKGYNQKENFTT